jgi:hypothetical protein
MKLPERQLVVEIEHDEQFVARPAPAGCHGARRPGPNHQTKEKGEIRARQVTPTGFD